MRLNIDRLEMWAAGYGKPIAAMDIPQEAVMERVKRLFNIIITPTLGPAYRPAEGWAEVRDAFHLSGPQADRPLYADFAEKR